MQALHTFPIDFASVFKKTDAFQTGFAFVSAGDRETINGYLFHITK
jgi:hypothetical protein